MAKIFILPPPTTQTPTSPKLRRNQRADKRFCVRVTVTDPVTGAKKQKPFYGLTQGEARTKADAFKKELDGGLPVDEYAITVSQWIDKWSPVYSAGKAYSTRYICDTCCNKIKEMIGGMRLRDVRENDLQRTLNCYIGLSTSSIRKLRNTINALFASATRNRLIPNDPSTYIVPPKGTYSGHRTLEPWEVDLICQHWRVRRAGFWALLMMHSGLRRGEACAMKVSEYDPDKKTLHVSSTMHVEKNTFVDSGKPKTPAGFRTIPIYGQLIEAINESLKNEPREFLLRTTNQEPLSSKKAFDCAWVQFLQALTKIHNGIDPDANIRHKAKSANWVEVSFTPHDLRYTYATVLYNAGVDEKTAQLWMGHTSPKMTRDLYAQLTKERENHSRNALEKHMENLQKLQLKNKKCQRKCQIQMNQKIERLAYK